MNIENLLSEFIIFDTEYTAWEGSQERAWSGENEYRELVQIGAIRVVNFTEVDSLLLYVRPQKNPTLSNYFIELTGITQEIIEKKGVSFEHALNTFLLWSHNLPLYSFGNDVDVLVENERLYHLNHSIQTEHFFDIRDIFESRGIETNKYMSSTIPSAFGVPLLSNAHDALNDARSILIGLQQLTK